MNKIKQMEQIVKRECGRLNSVKLQELYWRHINAVRDYAVKLAKKLKADTEIVEAAALLHDIGHIKFGTKAHENMSAEEAEKLLRDLNCDESFIKKVKKAVLMHKGKEVDKIAAEEKIIICADAMAHFDIILSLISIKELDIKPKEAANWHRDKMEKAWDKICLIPEAKRILLKEYGTLKSILSTTE